VTALLAMQTAVLARWILSVCPSVCPSVTFRFCPDQWIHDRAVFSIRIFARDHP